MTTTTPAAEALRGALSAERQRVASDYLIDDVTPACAFRPETREEVAALLARVDTAGLDVVPQGGRTALTLGRPLDVYDVALDTTGLDRVVAYEPEDLTVTVEAGMSLATLQALLGKHGQYLPVDPPPDDRVTIGGLLATARPGAWRGHRPAARDLVLGITVATAEGALVKSGGRVVKNVSGYDLHRMHTGALGAFGVIVEASFKVAPLPAATATFAVQCVHLEQAAEIAFALWDQALPLRALSLLTSEAATAAGLAATPHVLLEAAGAEAVIARCAEAVRVQAVMLRATGGKRLDSNPWIPLRTLAGGSSGVLLRLGVPASKLSTAIEAAAAAGCTAWGHLAAGSVLAYAPDFAPAAIEALRAHAREAGGFLQVEAAPAALRRAVDPFDVGERELMRALKQQFDPRGTLNRGRWMEGV